MPAAQLNGHDIEIARFVLFETWSLELPPALARLTHLPI